MVKIPPEDEKDDLPLPDGTEIHIDITRDLPLRDITAITEAELPGNDPTHGRRNRE